MFSIISTCKNRLSHLTQTLPSFLHQFNSSFQFRQDYEVIIVDYGCPEKTYSKVLQLNQKFKFPNLKVILVQSNTEEWNPGRARNIGANQATQSYLFFVDADMILQPSVLLTLEKIIKKINPVIIKKNIYKGTKDKNGTCVIRRKEFHEVKGYNEKGIGYCYEDIDIYNRLEKYRKNYIYKETEIKIQPIHHGWELRNKFNKIKDFDKNIETYYSTMCKEQNNVNPNGYGQGKLRIFSNLSL